MNFDTDNRHIFETFIKNGNININRSPIFDLSLPKINPSNLIDKIEGMLLGIAIGDSLGAPSESLLPRNRRDEYGEIKDYLANRYDNKTIGYPSDDTQLTFWTLEQLIEDKTFIPENVATKFCSGHIYGIGKTVRQFLHNHNVKKLDWYQCGPDSAGNGALMRISPIIIPHLLEGGNDIWIDTALCAMITHNNSASIASCISYIYVLSKLLEMNDTPDTEWWFENFISILKELELDQSYTPRGGTFLGYQGPLWKYCDVVIHEAIQKNLSVLEAGHLWYSGAYLLETVPSVLYILMRYGHSFEESVIRAVNDTKDNDSIAAIVGAAVGALHGKSQIPKRWIENLSGWVNGHDPGKAFELIEKTKQIFLVSKEKENA